MNTIRSLRFGMIFAGFVAILQVCSDSASAAIIQLKDSVQVNSSVVRLGDVAVVRDFDPQVVKQLEAIVLAPAPSPRTRLLIQLSTIRSALQARGVNLAKIDFTGKSLVMVSSVSPATTRQKLIAPKTLKQQHERAVELVSQAIRQYLRGQAPEIEHYTLKIEINTKDVPLVLSAAGRGYFVRGGGPPWDQPLLLYIQFLDRNEHPRQIRITTTITPLPVVLIARYTIPKGHVLRKTDLTFGHSKKATNAINKLEDAVGKETTRTIRKGEVLRSGDVKVVPLVRRNDIVSVYSRKPGITVSRQFKAKSEGGMHETITLVSLDGRQKLLATVIGFHEAEVIGSSGPSINRPQQPAGRIQFRSGSPQRPSYSRESLEAFSPISTRPYSTNTRRVPSYRFGSTPQRAFPAVR